ncbi:MAG: response regulator transcription factor [Chloroflexota bacterium]
MNKTRILVVDDDAAILRFLSANLKARGYEVALAMDGEQALEVMERGSIDLIILDIMMPKLDGVEACRRVREWSQVPIIVLSARGEEKDKVRCLELGADDYLTKPFGIGEMLARVQAALRRSGLASAAPARPSLVCGEIEVNFAKRRVTLAGGEVRLTPTEFSLLQLLATNSDKVLTHTMLLQKVWGPEYAAEKEYLRVFIGRLRKKIERDPENPRYILTIPGVGYHFAGAN